MIEIDFLQKKNTDSSPYDSDKMAGEFIQQFNNQAFTVGQQVQNGLNSTFIIFHDIHWLYIMFLYLYLYYYVIIMICYCVSNLIILVINGNSWT